MREAELNKNITNYQAEVARLKKEINYMKDSRNDRVYEVKLQLEREGREEMEERARELVLNHCNDGDEEIKNLKFEVLELKKKYSSLEAGNKNYTSEEKGEIDRLLKEISDCDAVIKRQFQKN
jgi:vacuolar-type H+-ATPase subunit H